MTTDERRKGFERTVAPRAGVLGRMLGRASREAAFIEIRNILAVTPFESVSHAQVSGVLAKSKLRPREVAPELQNIYEHAACFLAADLSLSTKDCAALFALQEAFELTNDEASVAMERAAGSIFQHEMREALADGVFTPGERARLEATAKALGLEQARMERLYAEAALAAVQGAFDAAVADRRYGDAEEKQVQGLAASLGVTIQHDAKTVEIIKRFRQLARIDEGQLPQVSVPILLQRGETCHFAAASVEHKELRTVTTRVNYSGPTASIRIMKGVRWRVGSISAQRVTQDILTGVDTVDVYVTSKKILLQGARKNSSIPLNKVVHFDVFSDGLKVDKQSGRDLYLVGAADWEMAGACLDAAVRRAQG